MIDVPPDDPLSSYLLWVAEQGARPEPMRHRVGSWQEIYSDPQARQVIERGARLGVLERLEDCGLLPLTRTVTRWHVARDPHGGSLGFNVMTSIKDLSLPVHRMPLVGTVQLLPTDWYIVEATVAVVKMPPAGQDAAVELLDRFL